MHHIYHIAAHIKHALISISCLCDDLLDIVYTAESVEILFYQIIKKMEICVYLNHKYLNGFIYKQNLNKHHDCGCLAHCYCFFLSISLCHLLNKKKKGILKLYVQWR